MLRILVVEDQPSTVAMLETLLRAEGHLVQSAPDGAAGLAKARTMHPDVVLTDLEMPGMTGNQLIAALRADPRLKEAYVVVLTVYGEKSDKMKALLSGADDFLVKSARPEEIAQRVGIARRVLQAEREAREARGRLTAPDSASLAALEVVLGQVLSAMAEGDRALGRSDAAGARARYHESRAAVERALAALRGPPAGKA